MSDLVVLAEEIGRLRRRLDRVEAQEHGHEQYLLASGARDGATGQVQAFGYPVVAPWVDRPLVHGVDSDHFNQYAAGVPSGWTVVNGAANSSTNFAMGFWKLTGNSSTNTAWKFRRRLAAITESTVLSLWFGPVLWRDGRYAADLTYTLGMYRDDGSGAIDETQYNAIEVNWLAASAIWRVRNVMSNGATTYASDYMTLSLPLVQPLYFRVQMNPSANTKRGYIGTAPFADSHTMLQEKNLAITFNTPWLQIAMARGAGVNDYLYFGGYDRTAEV